MKRFEIAYIPRWRLVALGGLVVIAMLVLLDRLWDIEMRDNGVSVINIQKETTVSSRLSSARGAILDRNGISLAENRASFDVDFYLDELVRDYKRRNHGVVPKIGVAHGKGKNEVYREEPDIEKIVKDSIAQLSEVAGLKVDINGKELQNHYYQNPNIPYQYRTNIDFQTLARFSEHNLGVLGIDVAVRPTRYYNYGSLAAHILGYVGKPTDNTTEREGHQYDSIGHAGLENEFDTELQGTPGGRVSRINYKGYIVDEQSYTPPTVGNSLYLTIDARIQYICEEIMRNAGRGAAVVMDPNNGDILAMVSVPSYDPNAFIPKIDAAKWKEWNTDPTSPLINRAISPYSPGSTFKVLVASAALKTGTITPNTVIDCPFAIQIGNHLFHDHSGLPNGGGLITMHDALRLSCNVFFYQVGIKTGIKAIDDLGAIVGFGQKSGIPIPAEQSGELPGPEWLKTHHPKENWTTAYTANSAIGQQYVEVTPLQMAVLVSSVANGGTVYYPRLTIGVSDMSGNTVKPFPTKIRGELGLKPDDMAALHDAMWDVVKNGTGRKVQLDGVDIAGKSGSAQHTRMLNGSRVKDTTAWFISFAPYEKPRYAVVVVVEGGVAGGSTAGPLVHDIYQQIFNMEKTGESPKIAYLTPAIGNFDGVSEYVPSPSEALPTVVASSAGVPGAPGVPTAPATSAATDTVNPDAQVEPVNESEGMTPTTTKRSSNRAFSR